MMDDEDTWDNLTKYYQQISEKVWKIDPVKLLKEYKKEKEEKSPVS